MPTVTFLREGKKIEVEEGANLRQAAMDAGISVYKGPAKLLNCLGNGLCGTCLVYVKEGQEDHSDMGFLESLHLNTHPITLLHRMGHEQEARLSCQMEVREDIVVDTEPELNLYGDEEHQYARQMKGEKYVEFPDHAPRGVREKKERAENNTQKDWFHEKRTVKQKSNRVESDADDESEDAPSEEDQSDQDEDS
jgi:ferredoxin